MYIYGQITRVAKDRHSGNIFITRGDNAGKEIKFIINTNIKPPVKHGAAVRMAGYFDKDNTFIVSETNGIAKEITTADISILGIPQDVIETALETAGVNTLYELYSRPETKDEIAAAIDADTANQIFAMLGSIMRDSEVVDVYDIFQKSGVGLDITDAINITDQLKHTAARRGKTVAELILEDPWILHRIPDFDVTGMLQICDQIARTYNIMPGAKKIAGCLIGVCVSDLKNGNTFMDRQILVARAAAYLKEKYNNISTALYSSRYLTQEKGTTVRAADNEIAVYLSPVYFMEQAAVEKMALLLKTASRISLPLSGLKERINEWETTTGTTLDIQQRSFIEAVADHKVTLLTGRAGSGKSTALKALLHALKAMGIRYAVLAPTGIAAQRVAAETGGDYYTVHRYAGIIDDNIFDQQTHEREQEDADVIIIDEMSMMTVSTFSALLSVMKPTSRLILAGDPAQLPPIGPGGVFDALIRAAANCGIAHIDLKGGYRMKENINRAANELRDEGYLEQNDSIKIVEAISWKDATEKTIETVTDLIKSGVSYDDILVLACNRGNINRGTVCLNQKLKQAINPTDEPLGVGDPVIAIRNDYEEGGISGIPTALKQRINSIREMRGNRPTIFNGTRGIITAADDRAVIIQYKTPGGEVKAEYNPAELLWYIEPAYAMTVHKAQGGKSKHVIFVEPEAGRCSRNMLYTALSRCSGDNITLIGSGWDSEFKAITPKSRFDSKLTNAVIGTVNPTFEEPVVMLIE